MMAEVVAVGHRLRRAAAVGHQRQQAAAAAARCLPLAEVVAVGVGQKGSDVASRLASGGLVQALEAGRVWPAAPLHQGRSCPSCNRSAALPQ